ncbi:chaplin [Streptomyces sp. NPDC005573]|uniref:chaplin n=1 Tax=Streptomyces sp. NPDC005573 TaxID=3156890 RepID=UPI0033BDDBB7
MVGGAGLAMADAGAQGAAAGSPGVLSGNVIQVPVNIPVNVCGNTIDVIGLLNPAFGNTCANVGDQAVDSPLTPRSPGAPTTPGYGETGYGN